MQLGFGVHLDQHVELVAAGLVDHLRDASVAEPATIASTASAP